MDFLNVQSLGHQTSDDGGRSSVHGPKHVNHPDSEPIAGVHPGIDGRTRGAQKVPVKPRKVDLSSDRRPGRCSKVEPDGLQLDYAGHCVLVACF